MRRRAAWVRFWLPFAVVALAAAGCRPQGREAAPSPTPTPNWARDVGPLVWRRCGDCHGRPGTAATAPPSLATYEDARRAAGPSLLAIRRRSMPPFGADNTGLCGTWLDAAWLTDAEIAAFGAWVENAMPAGDVRSAPPVDVAVAVPATSTTTATPPPDWASGAATVPLDPGAPFSPGLGERAYRCFVIAAPPNVRLVTSVTVTADPAAAVRLANLFALPDAAAARRARALDAADAEPGWPCYDAPAIARATLVASWNRNTPVARLPPEVALALGKAAALVLQLRYDLVASAPGTPVRARMFLAAASERAPRPRAARLRPLASPPFRLTPGQAQAFVRAEWTVDVGTSLAGVVPRMHTLGRVLHLERVPAAGGPAECLAHFGHWDVYDRQLFRADRPLPLAPGDRLRLTCTFATTSRTAETEMGEAPDDEQCLAHLLLVDAP